MPLYFSPSQSQGPSPYNKVELEVEKFLSVAEGITDSSIFDLDCSTHIKHLLSVLHNAPLKVKVNSLWLRSTVTGRAFHFIETLVFVEIP